MADRQQFLNVKPADPELLELLAQAKKRNPSEELVFEVREDDVDGGYTANASAYGIHTQGDTLE